MNEKQIIRELEQNYNPDWDLILDAPDVTFTDNQLLVLIKDLYRKIEQLEKRIDRQPLPYPGEGGRYL